MLIDAGSSYGGFDAGERIVAPYLWSQKIMHVDYIALSHPDLDHFGGLDFIAMNFCAAGILDQRNREPRYKLLRFHGRPRKRKRRSSRSAATAAASQRLGSRDLFAQRRSRCGKSHNNSSMVLAVQFRRCVDFVHWRYRVGGERALIATRPSFASTVLKVPHHGSATSSTPAFIAAVLPETAVISDGYLNHFHFPSPVVLGRYPGAGVRVLRTR